MNWSVQIELSLALHLETSWSLHVQLCSLTFVLLNSAARWCVSLGSCVVCVLLQSPRLQAENGTQEFIIIVIKRKLNLHIFWVLCCVTARLLTPGGTASVITGAKSVLILFFISTVFYVPLCDTETKLWSAYNLKVCFSCQVLLLQSLRTEMPFRSWHLEKSVGRLLSAKSVCMEEAQGLDRLIFFSSRRRA